MGRSRHPSEDQDMSDLALISTDDLIEELESRHDASIFAAIQHRTNDTSWYYRRWDGGNIPCLGLARFITRRIEQACDEMDATKEPPDERAGDSDG